MGLCLSCMGFTKLLHFHLKNAGEFCRFKNGLGGGVNYVAIEPNFTLNHSQDYS